MFRGASLKVVLGTVLVLAGPAAYGWLDPTDPTVVTVKDIADNQFSFYNGPGQQTEWLDKHGSDPTIRLKGAEDISGFKFDLSAHKGKTVQQAELHLARSNANQIFAMVAATINTDWTEASACWRYRAGTTDWTFSHSDFATATFGNYGSLVCFGYPTDDTFKTYSAGGYTWIAMKLDPALVQALILDQPGGLAVTDPRGHSDAGVGNPTVYAREAGTASQPRLYIQFASSTDATPPGPVSGLVAQAGPENGHVVLQFNAPSDPQAEKAFGYTIRYGTPGTFSTATNVERWRIRRPGAPGAVQRVSIENLTPDTAYTFYVQAYDAAGNGSTVQSTTLKLPAAQPVATLAAGAVTTPDPAGKSIRTVTGVLRYWAASEVAKINPMTGNRYEDGYTGSGADDYKKANVVWDAGTNTISLIACRNEIVAAQLIIQRLGTSLSGVQVAVSDLTGPGAIAADPNVELFQIHYVMGGGAYYGDAAIPLKAPFPTTFNIPDNSHNPSGSNQSVWMDFYVPKTAAPGDYTGTITLTATQLSPPVTIDLKVHVSSISIPDYPTFIVDLNGYGAPWDFGNVDMTCLRYFQATHKHRAVCNILPYSWSGSTRADRRPNLTGTGGSTHAADWTAFDARYGRFFDGTAFLPTTSGSPYTGPGQGTPITHFYTTFHEIWPVSLLDATYGFDPTNPPLPGLPGKGGTYWDGLVDANRASFFATLPDIYPSFPDGYKQGNRYVIADWFTHAQSKGWTRTAFECYLNNKYYYSGSHALWELEECTTADDFRAVGFFHQLYREGQTLANASNMPWHFRIDISTRWSQHWGQLDNRINWQDVSSAAAGWHWPNKEYRKYSLDADKQEDWIWYGLGAPIAAGGIGNAQAFLQKWCQGFAGGLPYWDNYQTSWSSANDLSAVYSGQNVPGIGAYDGAIISTRVKMMRQVQQVIELLNLWAGTSGMNRQRVRDAVSAKYGDKTWDYAFSHLDELKLYKLHADLIEQLDPTAPPTGGLQVTPATDLNATGPKGGPFAPISATYTLTNASTASLAWTAGKGQAWVTLSKTSGSLNPGATDSVTVSLDSAADSLDAGTYTDTVTFTNTTNGNGNTTRSVSLTVQTTTAAHLQVTPLTGLTSAGPQGGPFSPASTTYTVTNAGTSPLTWTAGKTAAWISLSKTGGALAPGGADSVTVSLNTAASSLLANTYTDTVTFTNTTNGDGNTSRTVSLTVGQPTSGLVVTPAGDLVSAGVQGGPFSPASITYTLANAGTTTLNWAAGHNATWASLSKAQGTLAGSASDTVTVSISAAANNLAVNVYHDTVTFTNKTDGKGDTTRGVTLTVTLPVSGGLTVTPVTPLRSSGLVGGPFLPANITYTLTNTSTSPLDWTAGKTANWLALSKTGGTLNASASDTVAVSIDSAVANALPNGLYSDTVTFTNTTNGSGNTTRDASLSIRLPIPGTLEVSPVNDFNTAGTLGGPFRPIMITYTLTNTGDLAMDWTASKTAAWLKLSKAGGSLSGGLSDTITISLDSPTAAALAVGTYNDTISFTNSTNGLGNTTRAAGLLVTPLPPGALSVAPSAGLIGSGTQGGPFPTMVITYTLTNSGGQAINWSASKTAGWLTLSRTGGSLTAGASDSVTLSVNSGANALTAGTYTDTVVFTNTTNHQGDATRSVSLTVELPAGSLVITPAGGLNSSGGGGAPFHPASITYNLSNPGGNPIAWTAENIHPWVSLSKGSGVLNPGGSDTITVSIGAAAALLNYGWHYDTVTFNVNYGTGDTTRGVSLHVVLSGDADGDGVVNMLDVLRLVQAYGASQGQPGFDPACDVDQNDRIDMSDVLVFVNNFGKRS